MLKTTLKIKNKDLILYSNFTNFTDFANYIEDQYNKNGNKTQTGSYKRLDYDASGDEYTVDTCIKNKTNYEYDSQKATIH